MLFLHRVHGCTAQAAVTAVAASAASAAASAMAVADAGGGGCATAVAAAVGKQGDDAGAFVCVEWRLSFAVDITGLELLSASPRCL